VTPGRSGGISAVASVLVALGLVAALTTTAPDRTVPARSWVRMHVGETGSIRDLSLRVLDVRVATTVDAGGTPLASTEAFVVVGVEAAAMRDPVSLTGVSLDTSDGHGYDPRGEWSSAKPPTPAQPGFTVAGTWVFEVPRSRLAGAALLVENDGAEFDWYDRGLRVDLEISDPAEVGGPVSLPEGSVRVSR